MVTPAGRREAVAHLTATDEMSERRACQVIRADRKMVRYRSRRPRDEGLRERLRQRAAEQRRFGYRRLHVLLRGEGHGLNRKKTQRLYREEGLSVHRRRGCKRSTGTRAPLRTEAMANARWSVDFAARTFGSSRIGLPMVAASFGRALNRWRLRPHPERDRRCHQEELGSRGRHLDFRSSLASEELV